MIKKEKTGGREKGTPNKLTAKAKELIQQIINEEAEELSTVLMLATPKQRLDFFIQLLPYTCAKQKTNIQVNGDLTDFEITINGNRATLYTLFKQEERVKRLEKFYDTFHKK